MQTRKLARQGLEASTFGLGCMGISDFYGDRDEAGSIAAIKPAPTSTTAAGSHPQADPVPHSTKALRHFSSRVVTVLGATLAAAACAPSGHLGREQAPAPVFDPVAFFAGHTEGRGELTVVLSGRKPTLVEGHGVVAPDGSIDLDQVVRRGDKPPTRRTWHLYRASSGHYTGTLSDASGPVAGDVTGNRLHLSFAMKGGLHAEQFLYLRPGGQMAQNRMIVSKLGMAVASLDETITRVSP